jgi:hypothetical protein
MSLTSLFLTWPQHLWYRTQMRHVNQGGLNCGMPRGDSYSRRVKIGAVAGMFSTSKNTRWALAVVHVFSRRKRLPVTVDAGGVVAS